MKCNRENIKFYLETITASVLTFMALVVSLTQCSIADKQTKLTEIQTEIAKQQISPVFSISAQLAPTVIGGNYDDDVISIKNNGYSISDFHTSTIIIANIELSKPPKFVKKSLFISGYYESCFYTANGSGLLATLTGISNNKSFSELYKSFTKLCEDNDEMGHIEIDRYIRITYKNAFDEQYEEFYKVPLIFGGYKISSKQGNEFWDMQNDATQKDKIINIKTIKASEIYHIIKKT